MDGDSHAWLWDTPQFLKGIGPKKARELQSRGVVDVYDLLNFLPRGYRDYRAVLSLSEAMDGVEASFRVRVVTPPKRAYRRRFYRAEVEDDSGLAELVWFSNKLYGPSADLQPGQQIWIVGKPSKRRTVMSFSHPRIFSDMSRVDIEPMYRGIPWLSGGLRKAVKELGKRLQAADPLPAELRDAWQVPDWRAAFTQVHAPGTNDPLEDVYAFRSNGYRRVAADAFFSWFLGMGMRRRSMQRVETRPIQVGDDIVDQLRAALPFALTGDQQAALDAILQDMNQSTPMFRLVQGDVGSGKTAVALLAAAVAARAGGQVALLAPTEILAGQHARFFDEVLGGMGIRITRLTGSLSAIRRKEVLHMIRSGAVDIVIGTHALLQDAVEFQDLRLVVIDEEQRYGVMQRSALRSKGGAPHTLLLSATPIPRSLSLVLLGDTDVTVIREKPAGRAPVETRIIPEDGKREVLEHIKTELDAGHKVFFLYPRVDDQPDSDQASVVEMHQRLADYFGADQVGLLHGRMAGDEKDRMLRSLKDGRISILVTTTVIEVGVDVPDATILVIGHPDNFGLSQLHQIRGRIGRGNLPGTCYLLVDDGTGDDALARLDVMTQTNDGFEIAEADLELRGPGSMLGTRQSGIPDIHPVLLRRFSDLATEVRASAEAILDEDPHLTAPQWRRVREILQRKWDMSAEA